MPVLGIAAFRIRLGTSRGRKRSSFGSESRLCPAPHLDEAERILKYVEDNAHLVEA